MSLLREAERCLASQKLHSALNAFITPLHPGQWLDRVRDADLRHEQGRPKSPIDGRLISIKDNICTRDLPTTCASGILDSFTSPFNATVVDQLETAGAVVAGKTNLDEFGMGSHSVNSRFGPVEGLRRDASGEALSAGGSSGGAAVAVASGQCYAALGTDTGGSVRLPAAYTGIVGFKPSYGLVSRWGVVAYSNSLDTVGILGRDASSIRNVFGIVNKPDPRDPTNISPSTRSRIQAHIKAPRLASRASSPLKVGVPVEYNVAELSPSVRQSWRLSLAHLQKQGHTIHPVSLPSTKQALSAYYILAPAEASSNLAKYDGIRYGTRSSSNSGEEYLYANTRMHGFGAEVKRRILLGTFSLSAAAVDNYFIQAQRVRRLVQGDFDAVFRAGHPLASSTLDEGYNKGRDGENVDVLVFPAAPFSPPRLSSLLSGKRDVDTSKSPLDAYMNDVLTVPASLAGLPAMSVPVTVDGHGQGSKEDLAGIQVVGQYGDDELVLSVGEVLERRRLSSD